MTRINVVEKAIQQLQSKKKRSKKEEKDLAKLEQEFRQLKAKEREIIAKANALSTQIDELKAKKKLTSAESKKLKQLEKAWQQLQKQRKPKQKKEGCLNFFLQDSDSCLGTVGNGCGKGCFDLIGCVGKAVNLFIIVAGLTFLVSKAFTTFVNYMQ